jgi:hypothetical protein
VLHEELELCEELLPWELPQQLNELNPLQKVQARQLLELVLPQEPALQLELVPLHVLLLKLLQWLLLLLEVHQQQHHVQHRLQNLPLK